MTERKEVYKAINSERLYQDCKWDYNNELNRIQDKEKSLGEWINYIEFCLNDAKKTNYNDNKEETLNNIRKITALGVRAMEIHGAPLRKINENSYR